MMDRILEKDSQRIYHVKKYYHPHTWNNTIVMSSGKVASQLGSGSKSGSGSQDLDSGKVKGLKVLSINVKARVSLSALKALGGEPQFPSP